MEYRSGALTVESVPLLDPDELRLPAGFRWPEFPQLGPALVVGSSATSEVLDAVRLKEALSSEAMLDGKVAVLHGRDSDLTRLGGREGSIGSCLVTRKARAAVAPAFSTWWDWSPFECHLAVARSAHVAAVLASYLPTAPTVVWRSDLDIIRQAGWLVATKARVVAVHLHGRTDAWFAWAMRGLQLLKRELAHASAQVHLIANGPSTVDRMLAVRLAWPMGLTFASQRPWLLAQQGFGLRPNLEPLLSRTPRSQLEASNRAAFAATARRIVEDRRCRKLAV